MAVPWRPNSDDVAQFVPQRTGDVTGMARASFGADTVPNDVQVEEMITSVSSEVSAIVGAVPEAQYELAKHVTALGAASYVELSFYPDQQLNAESPAAALRSRYESLLETLRRAVANQGTGVPRSPSYSFPAAQTTWAERY